MEGHPHRQDQVLNRVPEEYDESFQPVIGAPVSLRPLRPDDHDIETAFVHGLSPETRASRLLGGAIRISREHIEYLLRIDYSRDMALGASVMFDGRETLIGVARYALDADGRGCEFALVVADAWHGRGIGLRLLAKLVAVARARGLARIYGDTQAGNRALIGLAKKLGFAVQRHPEDAQLTRVGLALE